MLLFMHRYLLIEQRRSDIGCFVLSVLLLLLPLRRQPYPIVSKNCEPAVSDFIVSSPIAPPYQGGFRKEQSVSIFGGASLPWASKPQNSPGVEMDNKRRLGVQSKVKRAATNAPMSAAVKRRVEKEAAEERKKQEKLKKQLNGEKKGLFGMW